MLRRRAEREAGLTTIELLIVVLLLGIIMLPLGGAFVSFFKVTDKSNNLLAESQDTQLATFYFDSDVHSVGVRDWSAFPYPLQQSVELNVSPTGGLYPCGAASDPAAVIRLAWDNPTSASGDPQVVRVAYWVATAEHGQKELHRVTCIGSGTIVEDIVVAHNLSLVAAPVCSTPCTDTPPPANIMMNLVLHVDNTDDTPIVVTLQGQRRQT